MRRGPISTPAAAPARRDADRRERDICAAIGPTLREKGLVFVGIDVIGDYLTEINVTSPTGIQEINQLDGVKLEVGLWDAMERRYHEQHSGKPA